jgi:SAM-dependent methyltransferase
VVFVYKPHAKENFVSKKYVEPFEWPFPERRYPRLNNPDYLMSKGASLSLQKAIQVELLGKTDLNILDVGCGYKPYYPFLKQYANSYIGTDIIKDNPAIDIICPAENLQIEDNWADLTLCMSVLEHVDDPIQVVKELYRVTKPGGSVFAVTHGSFPWHPYPQDHWRWTQTGLPLLFTKYAGFENILTSSTNGTFAGMAFVFAHYIYSKTHSNKRGRVINFLGQQMVIFINRFGELIDAKTPEMADINRHVTSIPQFFVIANKK